MARENLRHTERLAEAELPATHRLKEFRVEVREGPDEGLAPAVSRGEKLTVGSAEGNTLRLGGDRAVSRYHLEMTPGPSSVTVRDLGSTNGTRIDAARFQKGAIELCDDADLLVGETWLRVILGPTSVVVPTTDAASLSEMVGRSSVMRAVFARIRQVAPTRIPVLITGETGTGKELAARAIHEHSGRVPGRFVVVDCTAIPASLAEGELFGTEPGGYTGAVRRAGPFERANGGTLFLDEIGELPLALQPKLLRALQEGTVARVGDDRQRRVDVRVVCATHRDLRRQVNEGTFREDLFFRLAGCEVEMPPLRSHLDDLDDLIESVLRRVRREDRLPADRRLTPEQIQAMRARQWPGNMRELQHHVRLLANRISPPAAPPVEALPPAKLDGLDLDAVWLLPKHLADAHFEREYLARVFNRCERSVTAAARAAQLNRVSLNRALQRHKLKR